MQQLLLILICLFVSFEVRSESDDLSGKKLLCWHSDKLIKDPKGFEFKEEFKVSYFSF